jgi:hypothetical protein
LILILASTVDTAAAEFAEELSLLAPAAAVTCRNLALERCELRHPNLLDSSLCVDGCEIPVADVTAALCVLPAVIPDELYFFPEAEREYQAMEFLAMLTFLFASLPCRVVNRPTSTNLTGPCGSQTAWYHLAHRLGIPIVDRQWRSTDPTGGNSPSKDSRSIEASYLGGRLLGAGDDRVREFTERLALASGVEFLSACCAVGDPPSLIHVKTTPNLRCRETKAALTDLLLERMSA